MNTVIPDTHRDLIDGPVLISFATIMPDGQPHLSVIWCNSDGEHVLINTARGRQKEKNIARDPRVTILAVDPNDPYRSIEIRGEVIEMSEEGGIEHIDELARIYTGDPGFYGYLASAEQKHRETRVICRIRPKRVRTEG
ncbi:MAG: PPOX class F420-dependent oxidoreductase [Candidatus Promineifilaceae bacterium]|jgi:PPOX class probable F420-dependent enzyme